MSGVVDTSGFLVPVEVKDTPQYGHLIAFVLQGSLLYMNHPFFGVSNNATLGVLPFKMQRGWGW